VITLNGSNSDETKKKRKMSDGVKAKPTTAALPGFNKAGEALSAEFTAKWTDMREQLAKTPLRLILNEYVFGGVIGCCLIVLYFVVYVIVDSVM